MTWAENNKWNLCVSASGLAGICHRRKDESEDEKNCNQFIICQRHDLHKFLSFFRDKMLHKRIFLFQKETLPRLCFMLCTTSQSPSTTSDGTWQKWKGKISKHLRTVPNSEQPSQRKCLSSGDKCAFSDLINLPFVLSFCWWPWGTGLGFGR